MTPIGQHFLIHFIYSTLWLWNTKRLENSPRKQKNRAWRHISVPNIVLIMMERNKRISLNSLRLGEKKQNAFAIPVPVSQHPSSAHPVPRVITPWKWLSRCEGCGWDRVGRLQRVPASPDDWCSLRFGGVCAAPVDRAAPPTCYRTSAVCFSSTGAPGLPCSPATPSPLPRSDRFMRKPRPSFSHLPRGPQRRGAARLARGRSAAWDVFWPGRRSARLLKRCRWRLSSYWCFIQTASPRLRAAARIPSFSSKGLK